MPSYILVAIAPDGTRSPLSEDCHGKRKVPREEAHRMSRKRAEWERNRMQMDFDLRGHRVEIEPFETKAAP